MASAKDLLKISSLTGLLKDIDAGINRLGDQLRPAKMSFCSASCRTRG